jgi:hypothetical protein
MIDDDQLAASSPFEVSAYLQAHGWNPVFEDRGGTAWAPAGAGADDAYEVWVPRSVQMRGYRNRVAAIVRVLGDLEDRSPSEILFEMSHVLQDVQRIRTLPASESGTVGLEDGSRTLSGIQKWIASAAASTAGERSDPLLLGRRPATVDAFLRQVKLVVPERGSFVWKVAVPLAAAPSDTAAPEITAGLRPAGFNRAVTRTMHDATAAVLRACRTVERGTELLPAFEAEVGAGVSAGLCEGLVDTGGERGVPYEITFVWSASSPGPPPAVFRFGEGELEIVRRAAAEFRRPIPELDVEVRGRIVRLDRPSDQRPGVVTILGSTVGRGREISGNFGFELTDVDYRRAWTSHGERHLVAVRGDLARRGNRRWLDNARDFRVLPEDPTPARAPQP